jgi:hypothetical protein
MSGKSVHELIVGPITCFALDKQRQSKFVFVFMQSHSFVLFYSVSALYMNVFCRFIKVLVYCTSVSFFCCIFWFKRILIMLWYFVVRCWNLLTWAGNATGNIWIGSVQALIGYWQAAKVLQIGRFELKPLVWNECVSKGCCLKCWIVLFNWQVLSRTFAACWCCYLLPTFATYQSFHGQLNLAEPEV